MDRFGKFILLKPIHMKEIISFLITTSIFFSNAAFGQSRGDLVSDSLITTLNYAEIEAIYETFDLPTLFVPIEFEVVELHKIVYYTLNGRGDSLTLVSGIVTLPIDNFCDFPLIAYNHGTHNYDQVISDFTAKFNQHYVGVPLAATGYVAVLPDYLGYGATPVSHPHPYIHAKSEATCVVDALRAARQLCEKKDVSLNEQLFLLGYSQGGHVTMASHKEIEEFNGDEFTVTASAPCSGPYDLSGMMRDSMLAGGKFSNSFFTAFVTLSYQYIYQNLYNEISEIFTPPYDSLISRMLSRENPESFLSDSLPEIGTDMFQPDYLNEIMEDDAHPFNQNLRDNDLFDWVPQAPVALFYCTEDEQVPYQNAIFTANYMATEGANVQAFNAGDYDHIGCTFPALLFAIIWFDEYRVKCVSEVAWEAESKNQLHIYPNPVLDKLTVSYDGAAPVRLTIFDMVGRPISMHNLNGSGEVFLSNDTYPAGNYIVTAKSAGGLAHFKLTKIK